MWQVEAWDAVDRATMHRTAPYRKLCPSPAPGLPETLHRPCQISQHSVLPWSVCQLVSPLVPALDYAGLNGWGQIVSIWGREEEKR